ncbi:AP-4 complex subunit sigma-1-like isoform X3 [Biomphalaria glabrata]|uniref:AP complex subunit sigma n=1 Tax=Biomphalaria glabrata TaxID=6526 RepID=A0A9W3A159_BIOGL|nr:AP-4 complex subunit sigma-1-like isoform X3 [Biomphalaria glabrata]
MILFCFIVNKQGRIRLRRNYQHVQEKERELRDTAVINKCLMRSKKQCNFFSHDNMTVVYKMFTTLTLICGTTKDENELAIQELLNVFMDCIATYFQHVIVYNIERVYIILDELIANGCVAYTSKERALVPLQLIDAGS